MPESSPGSRQVHYLLAAVLAYPRLSEAAAAFTTRLAELSGASRASLAFNDGDRCHLIAISHGTEPDPGSELATLLAAAILECIEQHAAVRFPPLPGCPPQIILAHQQVQRRFGGFVQSIPVVFEREVVGALLLEFDVSGTLMPAQLAELEHLVALVAPVLEIMRRNERSLYARLQDGFRQLLTRLGDPGAPGRRRAAIVVGLAVLLLVAVPLPHYIEGQARIEGEIQRVIVAPADGFLKQVTVRPGDRVREGQVLVELAEQDLQAEQRRWFSELAQHQGAHAAALARADRAALVIHQAKADEAQAHLTMIEQQLGRSQIRAPFDGIVIAGELTPSLGAPTKRGEALMTLAPEASYRVVIDIDERDITALSANQQGYLALSALPWESYPIRVTRITPMAHAVAGANVFAVEAEFTEAVASLHPGMQGVARLEAGYLPPLWSWTRRLGGWLAIRFWSWFGL